MIDTDYIPPCPPRAKYDAFVLKYKSSSAHFIERLKERYNIDLTIEEYNELLVHSHREYQGVFAKNADNTIGILTINGTEVWVLYNSRMKLFTTTYPPIIGTNVNGLIRACFSKPVRNVAYELYEIINDELNSERFDFEHIKDAALHYFANCKFPTLLIDKFKYGSPRPLKICIQIKKIIEGTHPIVSISINKRIK